MRGVGLAVAAAVLLGLASPATALDPQRFKKAYTEHLGALVTAPGTHAPGLRLTNELNDSANGTVRMRGTDLGVSFESGGGLYFLFGDSWVLGSGGRGSGQEDDTIAVTHARDVERFHMPHLEWSGSGGTFAPLRVASARHDAMEVPVEGIHADGKIYVFFVSHWRDGDPLGQNNCLPAGIECRYGRRVLGHFRDGDLAGGQLELDHFAPPPYFLNVSAVKYGGYVYLFGAGNPYRKSAVRLARFRPQAIDRRFQWRYLRGRGTRPRDWVRGAINARRLVSDSVPFPSGCVGELSVRRYRAAGLFLMAYNCAHKGIYLRTATRPWGPWSRPIVIYDGSPADDGAGVTQHTPTTDLLPDDGLAEPDHVGGRQAAGPAYGPYLIPRFFRRSGLRLSIVYTLSSWNPYKVHLMRTVLVPFGSVRPPERGVGLPPAEIRNGSFDDGLNGWDSVGTPFRVVTLEDPNYVSSYVPQGSRGQNGEEARGALFQDFRLHNGPTRLCFRIRGGSVSPFSVQSRTVAAVRLYHRNQMVRESFGWNDLVYRNVSWNIREFAGEPLRLMIADDATGDWGFIDATGFRLSDREC